MVCSRFFILFSFLFQCNTPLTLTSPSLCYWQAKCLGPRTVCSKVLFCFHCYFNAVRPRPSSVPLILVFRCHPQAKYTSGWVRPRCRPAARGGGGGHARAPVRRGGRGEGEGTGWPGRESDGSRVELSRATGLVASGREVRATPGRPGRTARARPSMTHPLALPLCLSENETPLKEAGRTGSPAASEEPDFDDDS